MLPREAKVYGQIAMLNYDSPIVIFDIGRQYEAPDINSQRITGMTLLITFVDYKAEAKSRAHWIRRKCIYERYFLIIEG